MALRRPEDTTDEPNQSRRRITSLEILLVIFLLVVFGRLIYHIVYWRDFAQAIAQMTAVEWVLAALFLVGYMLFNKWLSKL